MKKRSSLLPIFVSLVCAVGLTTFAHAQTGAVTNGQITFYSASSSSSSTSSSESSGSSGSSTSTTASTDSTSTSSTQTDKTKKSDNTNNQSRGKDEPNQKIEIVDGKNQINNIDKTDKNDSKTVTKKSSSFLGTTLPKMADSPQVLLTVVGLLLLLLVGAISYYKKTKKLGKGN